MFDAKALADAIFLSKECPEILTGMLCELSRTVDGLALVPVPTTLVVAGDTSLTIPATDPLTETFSVTIKDQHGADYPVGTVPVSYAISPAYTGVTVNATSGVVTVVSTTLAGTAKLVVTCGALSKTVDIVLTAAG